MSHDFNIIIIDLPDNSFKFTPTQYYIVHDDNIAIDNHVVIYDLCWENKTNNETIKMNANIPYYSHNYFGNKDKNIVEEMQKFPFLPVSPGCYELGYNPDNNYYVSYYSYTYFGKTDKNIVEQSRTF